MKARIYKPSRTAMQSGQAKTHDWALEFEQTGPRTIDPLMGWTSSSDTRQQLRLTFPSKEDAIAYAERNKIDYVLFKPREQKRRAMSYSDNFRFDRVGSWTH